MKLLWWMQQWPRGVTASPGQQSRSASSGDLPAATPALSGDLAAPVVAVAPWGGFEALRPAGFAPPPPGALAGPLAVVAPAGVPSPPSAAAAANEVQLLVQWNPALLPERWRALFGSVMLGTHLQSLHTQVMQLSGAGVIEVYRLPAGITAEQGIAFFSRIPGVVVAEQNYRVSVQAVSNDPGYTAGSLWGMYSSDAPAVGPSPATTNTFGSFAEQAWSSFSTGTTKTVVGVIDTGIDYTHPDLYQNIWLNQGELNGLSFRSSLVDGDGDGMITFVDLNAQWRAAGGVTGRGPFGWLFDYNSNGYIDAGDLLNDLSGWENRADNDGNGYADDLVGWNFVAGTNNPMDDHYHGTHVAGTIAAQGGNGIGVAGVTWSTQLVGLKFLDSTGGGTLANAIAAVDYFTRITQLYDAQSTAATRTSANYVLTNNSWGGGGYVSALETAIVNGAKAGNLFVAAAGNSSLNNDLTANYPSNYSTLVPVSGAGAGYEAVIAVASINSAGGLSSFSNYGATTVDLGAPGEAIYSTSPGGSYTTLSGTSMATPHVAGTLALMAANAPTQSANQLRAALLAPASVINTASLQGRTATNGRLNVQAAVAAVAVDSTAPQISEIWVEDGVVKLRLSEPVLLQGTPSFQVALNNGQAQLINVAPLAQASDVLTLTGLTPPPSVLDNVSIVYSAQNPNGIVDAAGNPLAAFASRAITSYWSSASVDVAPASNYLHIRLLNPAVASLAAINLFGNANANTLMGNASANTLNGGAGVDRLEGGDGSDIYQVDSTTDVIVETATGGTADRVESSVNFSMAAIANVENLTLIGTAATATGNNLNNLIIGNATANTLNGGTGVDRLEGGEGSDVYQVDSTTDVIVETATGGTADRIESSVTYSLASSANVENLTLTGTAAINGTGSSSVNVLVGNSAANRLNGGLNGALDDGVVDILQGGLGNDVYVINAATTVFDQIVEAANQGTDLVESAQSFDLRNVSNVENLTLTGTAAINGVGNASANVIRGNGSANSLNGDAGNDTLAGGLGIDTLTGGLGADIFRFDTAPNTRTNWDQITDFSVAEGDRIQLENTGPGLFTAITATGTLAANRFVSGSAFTTRNQRVLYNPTSGQLFYDADGSGAGASILFAALTPSLSLTNQQFTVT